MKTPANRYRRAAIAVALALLTAGAAAAASPAYSHFHLLGDYVLEVDGEVHVGAEMYSSDQVRAILVVSSKLKSPVLLWPKTFAVNSVNLMKMAREPDGGINLLPGAVMAEHPAMEIRNGTDVVFRVDGVEGVIKPKPALLGFQGMTSLTSHSPEYKMRADTYVPNQASLETLRSQGKDVRVQVYFGTWCPACGQMVPRIIKVAEDLQQSNVKIEFYGLPRGIVGDERAERYKIKSVPTGVVYVDGREVGRLTGEKWRSPEQSLVAMVGG